MGIFNFFRKIAKTDNVEEIVIEKLAFSEIKGWLEKKRKENEVKEKEILVPVKDKIRNFNADLRTKIIILKGFDVESKKAEDKIKNIVTDSREKYVENVENLIESLNNLKEVRLEFFTKKINKIFFDFNKSSFKNYERATILIGKEMANIRGSLRGFSKELIKIFEENQDVTNSFKIVSIIESKIDDIVSFDGKLKIIGEVILSLNKELEEEKKENKRLLEEIESIKQSPNYLERLTTQKKIESLKEELKNDIFSLKQLLDFKALANFFHINPEQMQILKNHREDFQTNFEKDNGKAIIEFLDEAKLNSDVISEKINLIRAKIEETTNHEKNLKEDETQEVYSKIKEVRLEIDTLKIEKVKEEKRDEKLRANKEELINSLKQELSRMNVEVI